MHFNSRPSARGDTFASGNERSALGFQFTPLREGRHEDEADQHRRGISIHAPPRGATRALTRRTTSPSYFNSRPSARGDTRSATRWHRRILFQFTPLREGRRTRFRGLVVIVISIHAPPRGATCVGTSMTNCFTIFQFTPLREGRHTSNCISCFVDKFQFTPLREGRLGSQNVTRQRVQISIHAPPRGATLIRFFNRFPLYFNSRPSARGDGYCRARYEATFISIHAPPRGATQVRGLPPTDSRISIHAPPRGATATRYPHWYKPFHFNSRPSARGDERHYWDKPSTVRFQFTPLREGRRHEDTGLLQNGNHFNSRPSARGDNSAGSACTALLYFNSRPSARGDGAVSKTYVDEQISIHAPPRGATSCRNFCGFWALNFNSRPSARGDGTDKDYIAQIMISIHAPPRGATIAAEAATVRPYYFNSRPSARGDALLDARELHNSISIHAPPRGATRRKRRQRKQSPISIHAPPRGATYCKK